MTEVDSVKNDESLAQEITALRNENAILKEQLALLQEQFDWLRKQVFGRKTEQTVGTIDGGDQLSLFPYKGQAVSLPAENITVPEHTRKKKRTHDEWMSELPVEEVLHKEDAPKCDKCGSDMT